MSFFRHNKIHNMVTNLKAVSFGSSGSRPFTPPNRLLISLGVPFGGVKSDIDMAWQLLSYDVPRDLYASREL